MLLPARRTATLFAATLLAIGTTVRAHGGAAEEVRAPTPSERVTYWLDRVQRGPEPTSFGIPNFHQAVLRDSERSLVDLGDATLDRLADEALRVRVQSQPDTNPWHSFLRVLAVLGPRRPALARAWAVPALGDLDLTLRRVALPVLVALRDPVDAPVVEAAFVRDAADRVMGAQAIQLLVSYGPPWDAVASRAVLERGVAELPDGTSTLWNGLTPVLEGPAAKAGRTDVLAWWALLAETSGPRAPTQMRPGGGGSRPIDPERTVVVSLAHALTTGTYPSAGTRSVLARRGVESARASARADLLGKDPVLVDLARKGLEGDPTPQSRMDTIQEARQLMIDVLSGDRRATPALARALVERLRRDPDATATAALASLLAVFPVELPWGDAIRSAFMTLHDRSAEPVEWIASLLRVPDDSHVDLALLLIPLSKDIAYIPLVAPLASDPAFQKWRFRARRLLAFLYADAVRRGAGLPAEQVAAFAAELLRFADDPADPAGAGLLGTFLELGPAGEAYVAKGLAGAKREIYVGMLAHALERPVGLEILRALVAPLRDVTPVAERRAVLTAVFYAAPAEGAPILAELASRLTDQARDDVERIWRIVRER